MPREGQIPHNALYSPFSKGDHMTRYLISFNDGDMNFPTEDFPAVGKAAHAVMRDAMATGAWIVGGGFEGFSPRVVESNGAVKVGPLQESPVHIGGFCIVEVATDAEALDWARKVAVACRCAQEVRKIMDDPEQEASQRR
jgi:hypothetical protein